MKYLRYIIFAVVLLMASACEDYLDKSPDSGISDIAVYSKYKSFKGAFDKVYFLDQEFFLDGWNGYIFAMGDEGATTSSGAPSKVLDRGDYRSENIENRWDLRAANESSITSLGIPAMCFKNLRTINTCLERLGEIEDATPDQLKELEGQAYFKRAWNYFQLIRRYGGFFKFDKVFDTNSEMDLPRLTYKESTDWLVEDLDKAYNLLPDQWPPDEKGRATKAMCLALKSMALLYAASPNMNDDKEKYDLAYCTLATAAAVEAIKYVDSHDFLRLMPGKTQEDYAKIFYNKTNVASEEAILYTVTQFNNTGNGIPRDRQWNASFVPRNRAATNLHLASPTQNFVDLFETADGLPIEVAAAEGKYDYQDPYTNRDPRFYYDLLTNGQPFNYENGVRKKFEFWETDTWKNAKSYDGTQVQSNYPRNAFVIRKWLPESCNKWQNDYNYYMQSIHIRVAQLYLDFAEAANEAYGPKGVVPGTNLTALSAINIIRDRVGAVPVLARYTGDKVAFRDRIRNERTVELCFENQRWHDIRRWHIAHIVTKNLLRTVVSRTGEDQYSYAYRLMEDQKVFEEKHYWYPIPQSQMDMLSTFTQNPGW